MLKRFLQYALVVCLLVGTGFGASKPPTLREQVEMVAIFLPVELNVPMTWKRCGDWNAFYYFSGRIELCLENLKEGVGVAREIYLHELGHAFTFRKPGFDFSRWGGNYEAAADEFAAVVSVLQGNADDLVDKALLWIDYSAQVEHVPGDPHPPGIERARMMLDLYMGFHFPTSPQGAKWRDALRYWGHQFSLVEPGNYVP